jgi:hypothetical protein
MTKRVVLSGGSPGLAAVDADLSDLAQDASGDGSLFLAGDGSFKAGGGVVQSVTVSLTSAQILGLNTTPVQLIAAPGAGNAIFLIAGWAELVYGTTAYSDTSGDGLWIATGTESPNTMLGFGGVLTNSESYVTATTPDNDQPLSNFANLPVVAWNDGGAGAGRGFTDGNGTANITLVYMTVSV